MFTFIFEFQNDIAINKNMKPFLSGKGSQQQCFDRAEDDKFFVVHLVTSLQTHIPLVAMLVVYYECCEHYVIDGLWSVKTKSDIAEI